MARNLAARLAATTSLILLGCPGGGQKKIEMPPPVDVKIDAGTDTVDNPPTGGAPTVDDALAFLDRTEAALREVWIAGNQADWVNANFLTEDTDALSAAAGVRTAETLTKAIKESVQYRSVAGLPADAARKLELLRRTPTAPAPDDAALRKELADILVRMQSTYGKGSYCSDKLAKWAPEDPDAPKSKGNAKKKAPAKKACLEVGDLSAVLSDPKASWDERLEAWEGWRTISPPIKADYQRYVELVNRGAGELGYQDAGDLWKSKYDVSATDMAADVERLWTQVKPLYDDLHCYVRKQLKKKYGDKMPADGKLPAHMLGNMWSQAWSNIYDDVAPYPKELQLDVTKALKKKQYTAVKMVETAENFYVQAGMPELPDTFWSRSLITKPRDRNVVCHASAWSIDFEDDIRIKMCTEVNDEDLVTLHHELGHNYYQRAYKDQPILFQDGANDGFHEAIGDTMALSVTPDYLVQIGLFDKAPSNDKADLNTLMRRALDKVAFLPFGYLIDKWRWDVFNGSTSPDHYNQAWWDLVNKYQGVASATPRGEEFFDPGAKYHVPASVPYLRYFLADIYQFQFHRALCQTAGYSGPLHKCSIFKNKDAGAKMYEMLQMGQSKPWGEAMRVVTGSDQADATAILEYFEPLQTWLKEQTKGEKCGW